MRMDDRARAVLGALEERSLRERHDLEALRARGGTALREQAARFMLDVGPEVGLFLNMLVRAMNATTVVEVGGSVGYSTIWLAQAVVANNGRLYSIEVDAGKRGEQEVNLDAAGVRSVVTVSAAEADQIVAALGAPIDLVLLDHWKELYVRDFDVLWPQLRPGGVVLADNMLRPAKNEAVIAEYRRHVLAQPDAQTCTLPIGDGVEMTTKTPVGPARMLS